LKLEATYLRLGGTKLDMSILAQKGISMPSKQQGFSALLVIIIFCGLAAVGFVGYRVWEANQPKSQGNQNSNITQTQPENQHTTDSNHGYVVIKEWGVRFKPADGVGTPIYGAWPAGKMPPQMGLPEVPEGDVGIVLSTQELMNVGADCNTNHDSIAVWRLYRFKQQLHVDESVVLGKIGDYYYYYFSAQAACVTNPQDDELNLKSSKLLRESFKNLEVVQ
jgi:hypothetical protein